MLYAAYGSNLHPGRLRRRIASARWMGSARVTGWRLRFHKRSWVDGSGKCTLLPAGREEAVFVGLFALDPRDRIRLDGFEGLGRGYDERRLEIPGLGAAFTYVGAASHLDEALRPFFWYRDLVAAGCEAQGFPPEYVARVRAEPAVPDPDNGRRNVHRALIEELAAEPAPERGKGKSDLG